GHDDDPHGGRHPDLLGAATGRGEDLDRPEHVSHVGAAREPAGPRPVGHAREPLERAPDAVRLRNGETATLNRVDTYADRFSVAVVDGNNRFRTRLAMQLSEDVAAASFATIEALEDKVPAGTPMILILGP